VSSQTITLVELPQRLQQVAQVLNDATFRGVWPIVAQMAAGDVRTNFQEQHAPDGTPWVPLAHGRPGQPAGAIPLRDNGLLMASITGRAVENGVVVGTNLRYAPLHQYGGVVRPKKGKFLAIPLTREAKRAGSPRNYRGRLAPRINKARQTGVLIDVASDVAQYALVKEVTVPARPFLGFSPGLIQRIEALLVDTATQAVGNALQGGGPTGSLPRWP
jgi:phage virion morphogenesis protein